MKNVMEIMAQVIRESNAQKFVDKEANNLNANGSTLRRNDPPVFLCYAPRIHDFSVWGMGCFGPQGKSPKPSIFQPVELIAGVWDNQEKQMGGK